MKAKRLFISVIALCCTMLAKAEENDMLTVPHRCCFSIL